jgi:hypothetical protein
LKEDKYPSRDDHIDGGTCEGHPQFLLRVAGHPLQPRHATDGQQGNVTGFDAIILRCQGMPKLVEYYAGEQAQYEPHPGDNVCQVSCFHPMAEGYPADQDEKCGMYVNADA